MMKENHGILKFQLRIFSLFFLFLLFVPCVFADGDSAAASDRSNDSLPSGSENYYKTEKFLPGEDVVTPTGKKMKVWSTEGPVKVSPPPEPWSDPSKTHLDGSHIIIDTAGRGVNAPVPPPPPNAPAPNSVRGSAGWYRNQNTKSIPPSLPLAPAPENSSE